MSTNLSTSMSATMSISILADFFFSRHVGHPVHFHVGHHVYLHVSHHVSHHNVVSALCEGSEMCLKSHFFYKKKLLFFRKKKLLFFTKKSYFLLQKKVTFFCKKKVLLAICINRIPLPAEERMQDTLLLRRCISHPSKDASAIQNRPRKHQFCTIG